MPIYDSVNGIARQVSKVYDGVDGVARQVSKIYDSVDGVSRLSFSKGGNEWEVYSCYAYSEIIDTGNEYKSRGVTKSVGERVFQNRFYKFSRYHGFIAYYANAYTITPDATIEDFNKVYTDTYGTSSLQEDLVHYSGVVSVTPNTDENGNVVSFLVYYRSATIKTAPKTGSYPKGDEYFETIKFTDGSPPSKYRIVQYLDEDTCILIGNTSSNAYHYYYCERV